MILVFSFSHPRIPHSTFHYTPSNEGLSQSSCPGLVRTYLARTHELMMSERMDIVVQRNGDGVGDGDGDRSGEGFALD